jgi:hypothetical protein
VHLQQDGAAATNLTYEVKAQIGGKLAQLGSRLIDATSKKLAGEFFEKFSEAVAPAPKPVVAPAAAAVAEVPPAAREGWFRRLINWFRDLMKT